MPVQVRKDCGGGTSFLLLSWVKVELSSFNSLNGFQICLKNAALETISGF